MNIEEFSQFLTQNPHPSAAALRRLQDRLGLEQSGNPPVRPWYNDPTQWVPAELAV